MTAATDTKRDSLALYPGMEFKVGDRVCGTEGVNGTKPYYGAGDKFCEVPWYCMEELSRWLNTWLSTDVTEAYTEWTTPEPEHSEHLAFRYRITWQPGWALKFEAWSLVFEGFPDVKPIHDDTCAEDCYRAARKLLGIEPVAFPDEGPITVSLLTAVRIADELSGDSSVWEVAS